LSPLFSLIIIEDLSRALLEARRTGGLKGIKLGKSLYLTYLVFVDDVLLFYDGSRRDACKSKEILELYKTAIGMKINLQNPLLLVMGWQMIKLGFPSYFPFPVD